MDNYEPITEFFFIDSDNCDKTCPKLYGYAIGNGTIIENENIDCYTQDIKNGAFVLVEKTEDKLIISQDYLGAYGLYLFKEKDYFAISNSFIRLVEQLDPTHVLTPNIDFINQFLMADYASASYSQSPFHEIELLDRASQVVIDCKTKKLSISIIDYKERTVPINSITGLQLLDEWYSNWVSFVHNLQKTTSDLCVALSGGFDSRAVFSIFLNKSIQPNTVYIRSLTDALHTHKEDLEIATQIVNHYNYKINDQSSFSKDCQFFSLGDMFDISYYPGFCYHKQASYRQRFFNNRQYYFGGAGGECIRSTYWKGTLEDIIKHEIDISKKTLIDDENISRSFENIFRDAFRRLKQKLPELTSNSPDIGARLYRETSSRHHFGKAMVEGYFSNQIFTNPLLDLKLSMLDIGNIDLVNFITYRYGGDLITFKFDSNRKVSEEQLKIFNEINNLKKVEFKLIETHPIKQCYKKLKHDNKVLPPVDYDALFGTMSKSELIKTTALTVLPSNILNTLLPIKTKWKPYSEVYSLVSICYALYASTKKIEGRLSSTLFQLVKEDADLPTIFDVYRCLRIDVRSQTNQDQSFDLYDLIEPSAKVYQPEWINKNQCGKILKTINGVGRIIVYSHITGPIDIWFRGLNAMIDGKRIPIVIDLTSLSINLDTIVNSPIPICHDSPLHIQKMMKTNEVLTIEVMWKPHLFKAD